MAPRGFTYLWLLFLIAAMAAGLAGLGRSASAAVQREREAELIFRGEAIARAITDYQAAAPHTAPASLQDLVEDRRGPATVRHLRRVYTDPHTGQADWVLMRDASGQVLGVHSRSDAPAWRVVDLPRPAPGETLRQSDRVFAVAAAASAASAPGPGLRPGGAGRRG